MSESPLPSPWSRRTRAGLAVLGVAFALVACGGGGDSAPAPAPTTPGGPTPAPPPPPAAPGSPLRGIVRAPVGTQVVLQAGAATLPVTVTRSAGNADQYDATPFAFDANQPDGTAYSLAVTAPAGHTCSVYKGATGTLPVAQADVLVGCERNDDLSNRSTDSAVRGTYFGSQSLVIGGSNEPVGTTAQGYGEGRFVAFVSSTAGIAGNTAARRQVFWRDNLTGETLLVSANANGTEGNGDSWEPSISADGTVVVFESYASNLVAGDTNGVRDVFAWSALDPTGIERVSLGMGGAEANGQSYEPAVSADGRVIAFTSGATNLTPTNVSANATNVYRRDVVAGTNTIVSLTRTGTGADGMRPSISEDGNRIAFYSFNANIVANDTNGLWDIFVYDHAAGTRSRVSLTSTGGERNQGNESSSRVVAPTISGNGRYVAYATTASNVVPNDTNGLQDVFVVDTQTGAVVRASVGNGGTQGNADSPVGQGERIGLSYDGRWVTFSSLATNFGAGTTSAVSNALMRNIVTGETRALSNANFGSVSPVAVSRSGAYAAFGSASSLDLRYGNNSGLFTHFTGAGRAWWWVE